MCQVALAKLGRPPIDPLVEPTPPAAPPGGGGAGHQPAGTPAGNPARKVKNSQVLDQADEGEIPELSQTSVEEHFKALRKAKGSRCGRKPSHPRIKYRQ